MKRQQQASNEPKPKREERRDVLENRQSLLRTAEALVAERGVEAVTMTDIARAAGLGQGTLYRHFAHKGTLCEALLLPYFQRFQEQADAHFGYDEATINPLQLVQLFLTHFAYFIEEHTAYLQAIYTAYQTQGGQSFYECVGYQWNKEQIKRYLQNAITVGACHANLDSDYISDALLAAIQVDLYLYQRHTLGWSAERIVTALSQLIAGLATQPFHPLSQAEGSGKKLEEHYMDITMYERFCR